MDPIVKSRGGLGIDMDSVSDKLARFQMQNRTDSIRASPTAKEWGIEQESTSSGRKDVPARKESSWKAWAGERKEKREVNTDNLDCGNAPRISWPAEECEIERHSNAGKEGTSREGPGYIDNNWTWKIGKLEGSNTDADAAWGTGDEAGQNHSPKSHARRSKSRARGVESDNHWGHASYRGGVEQNIIPWGGEVEQIESEDVRNWEHRRQNSPVANQGREHRQSQEDTAENVEW